MLKKLLTAGVFGAILAVPAIAEGPESGLNIGDPVKPFHPNHITGPDKGTTACPP